MLKRYGWSLEATDWLNVRESFADRGWRRTFLRSINATDVVEEPGVYLVCASLAGAPFHFSNKPFSELMTVVYVGQAKNLRARFKEHDRGYRKVKLAKETFGKLEFWFAGVKLNELDSAEKALIDAFGPPCNDQPGIRGRIGDPVPAGG